MADDSSWCERCGGFGREPGIPHEFCWDRHADAEVAGALVERARSGSYAALRMLGEIGDPRAADSLRLAMSDPDRNVQRAAVRALGWSGTSEDVASVARLLRSEDNDLRETAIATIAELGGQGAADALAELLDPEPASEQMLLLEALAWLRDARALEPLRRLLPETFGVGLGNYLRGVGWSLSRIGEASDFQNMLDLLQEFAREADAVAQPHSPEFRRVQYAWSQFLTGTRDRPAEAEAGHRLMDPWFDAQRPWQAVGDRSVRRPRGARTIPRRHMVRVAEDAADDGERPRAKFGGQPDWRSDPTWPVDSAGLPLAFYGQLPLLGQEPRTAYIFIKDEGNTWEPLGPDNAVVVQPGPPPHLPTVPRAEGPRLFEWVEEDPPRFRRRLRMLSRVRYVELDDGAEPEEWDWEETDSMWLDDKLDWNKVGGTPLFLQGEESPPGEGWSFAFQFSADRAGRELGDGAECYGWVTADGRGAFGWQCH